MIEKLIAASARNLLFVALGVLVIIGVGVYAVKKTPLDALPDLSDVQVIVFTEWPGRAPNLVEDQVSYPIVSTMLSAPKVKVVRGYSYFGMSFVYIIFQDGTDIYWARSRVLEYMNGLAGKLPSGVAPVLGPDATGVGWAYQYAVVDRSNRLNLQELRTLQDWSIRYWLRAVPGVADVASLGGYVKQYQVEIQPNKLLAYGIPLDDVMKAIQASNNDVGGRVLEFSGTEYMVRGRGYVRKPEDLEKVVLAVNEQGTPVLLRDVARVQLGPDMRRGAAELDGLGEAVGGIVIVRFGENSLRVVESVKAKIRQVSKALPQGVEIVPVYDRSTLIEESIKTLKEKLIEESVIVSLVCILFLFHFRSALVAILTLPLALLMSFTAMYALGQSSNIMSLGGIAIAIGAMVDAAIVMVENAHKRLEHAPPGADRREVIIQAAQEVGKPLFYSLLIITVSFLPVFALEAQEGRLFRPLAFTKTFSMLFASLLSITVAPALMLLLIRGRIVAEAKNPINRFLIAIYRPVFRFAYRWRKTTLGVSVLALALTVPVFRMLGNEFMPPLYEGTLLFMPTGLPGLSITSAQALLQTQDKILKSFPEVESVFGKAGSSESATDPAPLEMMETLVALKPEKQWRKGMTPEKLIDEMDRAVKLPGVTNSWTMPIKGRIDMLTTGIRTPVGIKIFGPDLNVIQSIGQQIEAAVKMVPGTRNVYAERVSGGYFYDFDINRDEIARYGLRVGDVEAIIESAIGGQNISQTVEGRERYPINLRYPRDFRSTPNALERVLVSTPTGAQIPLGQLAKISPRMGPPVVRSEAAQITGWVFVDLAGRDIGGYVAEAMKAVEAKVKIPAGYNLVWSGQYESMQRAKERLKLMVPLTLFLVILLLYFNFRSVPETLIVLLSIPFAIIGAIWLLAGLQYNMSVAVWVGIIALAGVAAETGVVMIVYLDEAYKLRKAAGTLGTRQDLHEAVFEGAVQRVRPKIMTVMAIMMGLLPIMWSRGTGADVMKRIAAPMIGGMVSSTVLTLVLIPIIYEYWRARSLPKGAGVKIAGGQPEQ
ncbi:MAG: CusA/CzcA family heavy metal efflux RND transporter [Thermoanaerobaculia bacterium]